MSERRGRDGDGGGWESVSHAHTDQPQKGTARDRAWQTHCTASRQPAWARPWRPTSPSVMMQCARQRMLSQACSVRARDAVKRKRKGKKCGKREGAKPIRSERPSRLQRRLSCVPTSNWKQVAPSRGSAEAFAKAGRRTCKGEVPPAYAAFPRSPCPPCQQQVQQPLLPSPASDRAAE